VKFSVQSLYAWYRQTIRNPQYRGWIILGTLAYLVSPIDISPDVFPIVGQIDDVVIITLLLTEVSQLLIERFQAGQTPSNTTPNTPPNSSEDRGRVIDVEAETIE